LESIAVKTLHRAVLAFVCGCVLSLMAHSALAQAQPAADDAAGDKAAQTTDQEKKEDDAKKVDAKEEAAKNSDAVDSEEAEPGETAEVAKEVPPLGSDAQPGTQARVVLEDLNNPSGIAIQPETGTVFIADSGNYQIVKLVDGKAEPAITDFPKDVYGEDPKINIGPLGLAFLDKNTLVVGGGGLPDGEELLRVYELPADGAAIKADQTKDTFRLEASEKTDDADEVKGEGNFYALATTPNAVYVTCNGDDTKGWVSRLTRDGNQLSEFERFIATKEATQVDAPVGITVSPEGYLVVGQMGEISQPGDSLLTFYDVLDGDGEILSPILKTGLHDICAVAYGPGRPNPQMYVLDYAWADPSQGGLFQILDDPESETGMRAERIMTLNKPTAMAFNADGDLYITQIGELEDGNSKGQLILVTKDAGL
jgi:DNA-binding beta-propeller fold protein YncE